MALRWGPGLKRPLTSFDRSLRRRRASTGERSAEVERILNSQTHYQTLEMPHRTLDSGAAKKNYQRLVKLVHPDVCSHPRARDAFEKVQSAHATLRTPLLARQHASFVRGSAASPGGGVGVYAWLDQHALMIKPRQALAVLAAAVALQVACCLLLESETGPPQLAHEPRASAGGEEVDLAAAELAASSPPHSGGAASGGAVGAAVSKPRAPQGPMFSLDAGRPLIGHSGEEVERRFLAARMRQRQVLENSPLKGLTGGQGRAAAHRGSENAGERGNSGGRETARDANGM